MEVFLCHFSINSDELPDELPENRNDKDVIDGDLIVNDITFTDDIDYEQQPDYPQDDDNVLLANVAELLELPFENNNSNCSLPADVDILSDIKSLYFIHPSNTFQEDQNRAIKFLQDNDVLMNVFATQQYGKLTSLYENSIKVQEGETIPQSQLSDFMARFNTYMTSDLYMNSCRTLLDDQYTQEARFAVCFKIMTFLRKYLLKKKSEVLPVSCANVQNRTSYSQLSSTARWKIRYVGGYTVARLRSKYQHLLKTNLYKTGRHGISTYLNSKKILEVLSCFEINEKTLNETSSDPGSLLEISRKQNITRGLTNITDETYQWFGYLIFQTLYELNTENLTLHGSKLYEHTLSNLQSDSEMFAKFVSLVSSSQPVEHLSCDSGMDVQNEVTSLMENMVESVCATETVFCEIINKVLSVLTKQFSKDVTAAFEIKKKMEHRKQIKVGSKRKSTAQPSVRHAAAKKPTKTVQARQPARRTPREKPSTSSKASDSDTSESESEGQDKTVQTRRTPRDKPSTSALTSSILTSESETEDQTLCEKCGKVYKESEQWIACDSCEKWFHRRCAGLWSAAKWNLYQSPDKDFFCPYCQ